MLVKKIKNACDFLWNRAWLLLTYTAVIWGGNAVAARYAVNEISPMSLVFLRWLFVSLILIWIVRHKIRYEKTVLLENKLLFLFLGLTGFTIFSALFYIAAHKTTAVNITILQSSMPPLVLLGSVLMYKEAVTVKQLLGMLLAIAGIMVIGAAGNIKNLLSLSFNTGDMLILIAFVVYSCYTLGLKNRPALPTLVFFLGVSVSALITATPLFVYEVINETAFWPTFSGYLVLVFVTLGPSLTGQLAYMRGIELIGPGRAGLFPALVPCFGAIFAIILLNEPFYTYHAIALFLGIAGIYLAEWGRQNVSSVKTIRVDVRT